MINLEAILKLRLKHDKEHREKYNVPPAFCPLCMGKVGKLDPNYKETKQKVVNAIKKGKPILIN